MNKGKTIDQQDAEKRIQIMISKQEAAAKEIKELNAKETTKMVYPLGWDRTGELAICKAVCNRCYKSTIVASFGETNSHGNGSICEKCISTLFNNFKY